MCTEECGKRIALLLLFVFVFASTPGFAAVPPQYERLNQFKAALDAATNAFVGRGLIERVERLEDGTWRAWTNNCFVPITLTEIGSKNSELGSVGGQRQYRASVGEYHCN